MGKTLIGVECDPSCKWKQATELLEQEMNRRKGQVRSHEPYSPGDVRPTVEGYAQIAIIDGEYTGVRALLHAGVICKNACAIEAFIDKSPGANFGVEVAQTINDLKGE